MNKKVRRYIEENACPELEGVCLGMKAEELMKEFTECKRYAIAKDPDSLERIFNDWLFGLPSCFNTEIYDDNIVSLLKEWGIEPEDDIWLQYSNAIMEEIRDIIIEHSLMEAILFS